MDDPELYFNDFSDSNTLPSEEPICTLVHNIRVNNSKMKLYETKPVIGARLVNAVTGSPYYLPNYVVGSKNEDNVFKIKMINGACRNKSPVFIFDSPKQYEFALQTILVDDIKHKWEMKQKFNPFSIYKTREVE